MYSRTFTKFHSAGQSCGSMTSKKDDSGDAAAAASLLLLATGVGFYNIFMIPLSLSSSSFSF